MPQKTRFGAQLMVQIYGLIDRMIDNAERGDELATYNPPLARKMHKENKAILAELRELIEEKVEPRMERAAPPIEQRLAELTARVEALENAAPFRLSHGAAPRRKEGMS